MNRSLPIVATAFSLALRENLGAPPTRCCKLLESPVQRRGRFGLALLELAYERIELPPLGAVRTGLAALPELVRDQDSETPLPLRDHETTALPHPIDELAEVNARLVGTDLLQFHVGILLAHRLTYFGRVVDYRRVIRDERQRAHRLEQTADVLKHEYERTREPTVEVLFEQLTECNL